MDIFEPNVQLRTPNVTNDLGMYSHPLHLLFPDVTLILNFVIIILLPFFFLTNYKTMHAHSIFSLGFELYKRNKIMFYNFISKVLFKNL